MKNNKKWLAAPYTAWAAGFIIIPLLMIIYYAFTAQEGGGFTLSNFSEVFTSETMKALAAFSRTFPDKHHHMPAARLSAGHDPGREERESDQLYRADLYSPHVDEFFAAYLCLADSA